MRSTCVLLTFLVALSACPARAEVPPDAATRVQTAYKDIEALAQKTLVKGVLPKWSDPDGQAALARMWDAPAILGTPPYAGKDTSTLMSVMPVEVALTKSYILFTPKPGTQPDLTANSIAYQDEIARGSAFLMRVFGATLPALDDFVAHLKPEQMTKVRLEGIRRMRLGMLQEVTGLSSTMRSDGLKPENRAVIVAALADSAGPLSAAVLPTDREAMIKTVEPAMPMLTADEKTRMQGFIASMKRTDCKGLCALQ